MSGLSNTEFFKAISKGLNAQLLNDDIELNTEFVLNGGLRNNTNSSMYSEDNDSYSIIEESEEDNEIEEIGYSFDNDSVIIEESDDDTEEYELEELVDSECDIDFSILDDLEGEIPSEFSIEGIGLGVSVNENKSVLNTKTEIGKSLSALFGKPFIENTTSLERNKVAKQGKDVKELKEKVVEKENAVESAVKENVIEKVSEENVIEKVIEENVTEKVTEKVNENVVEENNKCTETVFTKKEERLFLRDFEPINIEEEQLLSLYDDGELEFLEFYNKIDSLRYTPNFTRGEERKYLKGIDESSQEGVYLEEYDSEVIDFNELYRKVEKYRLENKNSSGLLTNENKDSILEEVSDISIKEIEENITEPITEQAIEPVIEPIKETVIEPVKEAIKEPVIEPVIEPIKETAIEPIKEPVIEPIKEPIKEPVNSSNDAVVDIEEKYIYKEEDLKNLDITELELKNEDGDDLTETDLEYLEDLLLEGSFSDVVLDYINGIISFDDVVEFTDESSLIGEEVEEETEVIETKVEVEEEIKEEVKVEVEEEIDLNTLKDEFKPTVKVEEVEEMPERFKQCEFYAGMSIEEFCRVNASKREKEYIEYFFDAELIERLLSSGVLLEKKGKYFI